MLRTSAAFLAMALALSWTSGQHADSIGAQMVPITLAESGGRTVLVSRFEVSVASWRQCYEEGGCSFMPNVPAGSDAVPITGINYFDIGNYLDWANTHSTRALRLPTIIEWRAIGPIATDKKRAPLFTDPRMAWAANYGQEKTPSGPPKVRGSFSTTPYGIADLDGNVWEWTSSCFKPGFESDTENRCPAFMAGGAHEAAVSVFVRDPASGGCSLGTPPAHLGFRLVSDL